MLQNRADPVDSNRVDVCEAGPTSRLSARLYVIPLGEDRFLIYAPLRRTAFVGDPAMAAALSRLQAGKDLGVLDSGLVDFLQRIGLAGAGPEPEAQAPSHGPPRPTAVTLLLTTACNLRCGYCYANAGASTPEWMPLDAARRGIDFVSENAAGAHEQAFEVAYHGGGEPTLHWRVLTDSWEYARRRAENLGLTLQTALATNGILRDEQIDWITARLDSASVSLDGLPEIQDAQRPFPAGEGSSEAVQYTLARFDAAGFDYGIRMTVTAHSVEQLPESVKWICAYTQARHLQAEPVYALGRAMECPSAETARFVERFRQARALARAAGRELHFSAARPGSLTRCFCGVSRDNFVLTPSGRVSACHEAFSERAPFAEVFHYGELGPDGFSFNIQRLDHLRRQDVERKPYCHGCFARWDCGGDCYYKWLHGGGDAEFTGSPRCRITRALILDDLLDRIAAGGGWLWHEPAAAARDQVPHDGHAL